MMIVPHIADDDGRLRDVPFGDPLDGLNLAAARGIFAPLLHLQAEDTRDDGAILDPRFVGSRRQRCEKACEDSENGGDAAHARRL